MGKPTVRISLNADDMYFIMGSISCNVPTDEEKSPDELRTTKKLCRAEDRLRKLGT